MSEPDFETALARLSDRDRLLDREDPSTTEPEEAAHWLAVYQELLAFKEQVLAATESGVQALPATALSEAEIDLTLLKSERKRLHERYLFWRGRAVALGSPVR